MQFGTASQLKLLRLPGGNVVNILRSLEVHREDTLDWPHVPFTFSTAKISHPGISALKRVSFQIMAATLIYISTILASTFYQTSKFYSWFAVSGTWLISVIYGRWFYQPCKYTLSVALPVHAWNRYVNIPLALVSFISRNEVRIDFLLIFCANSSIWDAKP